MDQITIVRIHNKYGVVGNGKIHVVNLKALKSLLKSLNLDTDQVLSIILATNTFGEFKFNPNETFRKVA